MADYDSPDLLRRCKQLARRPSVDESFGDTDWYDLLTLGDAEVKQRIIALAPDAQYGAPTLMTTSDGGATYGFGTDADGDPQFPIGHCEIYASKRTIPDEPLETMVDFVIEGTKIRIPNDQTRSFADGGPWARFVMTPSRIDASHAPTLLPKPARIASVYAALELFAKRPGTGMDPKDWKDAKDATILTTVRTLRTQYNMQAALGDSRNFATSLTLLERP